MRKQELDGRRKYYLILDCETATLPYAATIEDPAKRQAVAIAKPLIYDLGWTIVDRKGKIYKKQSFVISEIFSVPSVFNTAYYADKRPLYLDMLDKGLATLADWRTATKALEHDLNMVEAVGAYNAMFDFKKAIPFTELYINKLYSPDFNTWETFQELCCAEIANGYIKSSNRTFDPDNFIFHGKTYPLFDIWGMACSHILNCDEYREMCSENGWYSQSGKYYKTSAESAYRFATKDIDFIEAHTALDDAEIESLLFGMATTANKNKIQIGITYFPFRIVGKVGM